MFTADNVDLYVENRLGRYAVVVMAFGCDHLHLLKVSVILISRLRTCDHNRLDASNNKTIKTHCYNKLPTCYV